MKDNNVDISKEKLEGKYMSSVKVDSKGQIVIPKEARELFNIQPGDTLVCLQMFKKNVCHRCTGSLSHLFVLVKDDTKLQEQKFLINYLWWRMPQWR